MARHIVLALALLGLLANSQAFCAEGAKWFAVEGVVNDQPSFMLRVDVEHKDRVYREGEYLRVRAATEKDCYLYIIYYSGDKAAVLFPNKYDQENFVRANQVVQVPQRNSYHIVCRPPFGTEVLHVVATRKKIPLFGKQKEKDMRLESASQVGTADLQQMTQTLQSQGKNEWAEARIKITTVGSKEKPRKSDTYAVCIGISRYQHDRIPQLKVSHLDAERMARGLRDVCGVRNIALLTNEKATKKAIEKVIFHDLVKESSPGDTVYVFFSGHGGRTADTNGDEADGVDEYLVPHDGILGSPDTMILDDTFARWMQELDGRKVMIILDNCYSGGSSKSTKGLGGALGVGTVDFLDGEMKRSKDLGQRNTMVLAACRADQLAWEIPDASKGSVLTYFLLRSFADPQADQNNDGRLSVTESYDYAKGRIADFVKKNFSAEQNPVLIDNANDSIFFKE